MKKISKKDFLEKLNFEDKIKYINDVANNEIGKELIATKHLEAIYVEDGKTYPNYPNNEYDPAYDVYVDLTSNTVLSHANCEPNFRENFNVIDYAEQLHASHSDIKGLIWTD